jgi:hypothetical protein
VVDGRADRETEALVAELASHCAELGAMLHESASALADLLPAPATDGDGDGAASPLAPDILEIATLQAQAAGASVEEWLREAVLAYATLERDGRSADDDGDRSRRARDDARRLRAESAALKAQTEQTAKRAGQARRIAGDGRPPPER